MVGVADGGSELAKLSVVDLSTAEVLINNFVQPTKQVIDWRTRWSGVTAVAMNRAIKCGQALRGWEAARQELWRFIDHNTILVGHALQHDLTALHLIHPRVVDTPIVTRTAVGQNCRRSWSLRVLSEKLARISIQNGGKEGHDCLEDAFAAREVLLRCILSPNEVSAWASAQREAVQKRTTRQQVVNPPRARGQATQPTSDGLLHDNNIEEQFSSDSGPLQWSDVAEDFGWSHPDTGYDPWSD